MYSKGQHDLFTKFYILYLLTKNKTLLPIVKSFLKLIVNKNFRNLMKRNIYHMLTKF